MVHLTSLRGQMLVPGDQGRHDREASRHSASPTDGSELRGRTAHKRRALAIPFKGLATFLSSFSLMFLYFSQRRQAFAGGVGLGNKATRVGNRTANGQRISRAGRRGQLGDTIGLPSLVCALLLCFLFRFWDHWKAIYPCVARLVFGRGFFFALLAHALMVFCYFSFYISIFIEIEDFSDLTLN